MTLLEWRIAHNLTQHAVADRIAQLCGRRPSQRSVCYWENGTMPHRYWRLQIAELTGGRVRFA